MSGVCQAGGVGGVRGECALLGRGGAWEGGGLDEVCSRSGGRVWGIALVMQESCRACRGGKLLTVWQDGVVPFQAIVAICVTRNPDD